ncbi:uncharacterized protein LOC113295334 [Papaver somniferum]|uniref:uncharacterized protein LOC113295334 n=1 Tax=Papaver somniferum TaxID=3469 RepID=UPI000E6F706A|nr:uncharacterized protein LOC113295334 [Papaver somniferum]
MASWSSPRPDGFYQVNWRIIGNYVINDVQSLFVTWYIPRDFNKTYLSMNPKTDIAKYPVYILKKVGFAEKFSKYIEQCISTTKVSIIVNGSLIDEFSPTGGIRQGDPLSLYLFIIDMEVLTRLLMNAASSHVISCVKAARNTSAITHLLFPDGILIFTKADMHNIAGILDDLNQFGMYSSQMINFDISSDYLNKNISLSARFDIAKALNMTDMKDSNKYLGVNILLGRDKNKVLFSSKKPIIQSFDIRLELERKNHELDN